MRLSRAILVMLLLHVVAVGGFIFSSHLRDRDLKHPAGDASGALEADDSLSTSRATSDTRIKTDARAPRLNVHIVQQGETLMRIANANGVTLDALVAANGASTVTAPLRPGQQLMLPVQSPDPSTQLADGTASALSLIEGKTGAPAKLDPPVTNGGGRNAAAAPDLGKVYVVGKGESIYVIAQRLKVSPDALLKLNQIDDPKKLRPGQKLRVPPPVKTRGK